MSKLTKTQNLELNPRQQNFSFLRPERWRGLPGADQEACRQALSGLLHQVVTQQTENQNQNDDDEREDTNRTP
jgi:hypothetical protein